MVTPPSRPPGPGLQRVDERFMRGRSDAGALRHEVDVHRAGTTSTVSVPARPRCASAGPRARARAPLGASLEVSDFSQRSPVESETIRDRLRRAGIACARISRWSSWACPAFFSRSADPSNSRGRLASASSQLILAGTAQRLSPSERRRTRRRSRRGAGAALALREGAPSCGSCVRLRCHHASPSSLMPLITNPGMNRWFTVHDHDRREHMTARA